LLALPAVLGGSLMATGPGVDPLQAWMATGIARGTGRSQSSPLRRQMAHTACEDEICSPFPGVCDDDICSPFPEHYHGYSYHGEENDDESADVEVAGILLGTILPFPFVFIILLVMHKVLKGGRDGADGAAPTKREPPMVPIPQVTKDLSAGVAVVSSAAAAQTSLSPQKSAQSFAAAVAFEDKDVPVSTAPTQTDIESPSVFEDASKAGLQVQRASSKAALKATEQVKGDDDDDDDDDSSEEVVASEVQELRSEIAQLKGWKKSMEDLLAGMGMTPNSSRGATPRPSTEFFTPGELPTTLETSLPAGYGLNTP